MLNYPRIVFMGTPEFAVYPLKSLVENGYNVVGIVTSPDKPAGRGQKVQESAVKKYALEKNLPLLQPLNLKDQDFLSSLETLEADLQIIVAFRKLPEEVWKMPAEGTFNLHASLLPQYRGAAPINWVIINGESYTGVTTFFIDHNIDTGKIILQEKVPVLYNESAGDLHDKLKIKGSLLVINTVEQIINKTLTLTDQLSFLEKDKKIFLAPKIHKEDCRINWETSLKNIYNFIRGLSPYPAAWTNLISPSGDILQLKIYSSGIIEEKHGYLTGKIITDKKSHLNIAVNKGFIEIKKLQLPGKKVLSIEDFLRGFQNISEYTIQK